LILAENNDSDNLHSHIIELKYFPRAIFRLGQERIYNDVKKLFDSYDWRSSEDNNPQERSFNPAKKKFIKILKSPLATENGGNFIFIKAMRWSFWIIVLNFTKEQKLLAAV
jgi:hypothetical protein